MTEERIYHPMSGWFPLAVCLGGVLSAVLLFIAGAVFSSGPLMFLAFIIGPSCLIGLFGCMAIAPNQARVLLLFGEYKGSVMQSGFFWVNPFFTKHKISLRIRNFETGSVSSPEQKDAAGNVTHAKSRSTGKPSKVNDRDGNPIDISTVVVWRVVNTAEAMFEVDDYEDFVSVQSEAALRNLASRHPYDSEDHEVSLRGNTTEVCDQLRVDIQERLDKAGVEVIEARISHLAYSPEIAAAMLQRQQAQAVVAARTKIVEGAVGMVEMALDHLAERKVVELDNNYRASLVSNLLVVLCSDRHTQPVVNTGSSYS
ncbi:SPFH domain-containing protein [uncultured Gimesia sp.]|jgi:regulator of protease activity HflC (stomatin/prohibitin superfamily)|uniref:SPFH domain-containing protein n=1 Tax=uncultured Gimesia sp. TaxID=1678688 RepID=UPI0026061E81|nr:SPFH domain-containing protein [uncultured Gimesia sp.]